MVNQLINLEEIRYGSRIDKGVLQDIHLTINRGDKIALVGKSGSGKTTLVKLIAGFIEPKQGKIYYDGELADSSDLRHLTTYISQRTYILKGTVLDNLLLGTESQIGEEALIAACSASEILEDIEALPQGFQTFISEDILSDGQKQRLAIANALLIGRPLLIFDVATSHLDSETEARVIENLTRLDRTMIFVAHRGNTINYANRIVKIDKGQKVSDLPNYHARFTQANLVDLH
ncbi:ATP-binding cassette domain-containing protein [Streptococcus dentasini]